MKKEFIEITNKVFLGTLDQFIKDGFELNFSYTTDELKLDDKAISIMTKSTNDMLDIVIIITSLAGYIKKVRLLSNAKIVTF